MKKKTLYFLVIMIILVTKKSIFGISNEFKFIIDELGIPQYNVKNKEINETIYKMYNEFIYGEPSTIVSSEQRWKSISSGRYTRNGVAGEYAILGYDYSGNFVYNYYFPLDRVSPVHLTKWNYLEVPNAKQSWINAAKYYSDEQIEYMKEAKWWFQNMESGKNDPYDQIEYNINANMVGLNKARLEVVATWKSKGSIYTLRRTESGGIGWATFAVEPISANAKVVSKINVDNEYVIDENNDEVCIPIKYTGEITDLSKYAKVSQIKEITSVLQVNDEEVSRISGSKIISVGNEYMLIISRDNIPQNNKIKLKVHSYVKTDFLADGLLQGIEERVITVKAVAKKPLTVEDKKLNVLYLNNDEWVVSPLAQKTNTDKYGSEGITEAGRHLILKTKFNKSIKGKIKNLKMYIDNNLLNESDYKLYESSDTSLVLSFQVPYDLDTSLYGLKSLREEKQNYFEINKSNVLKRKRIPHDLKIVFYISIKRYEIKLNFDTIDDFVSNMNTSIIDNLHLSKQDKQISLKEFLNN